MGSKRKDWYSHNCISFWLIDEEKSQVEANILLSGLSKGEYYRKAVLGQELKVPSGYYISTRMAKALEEILGHLKDGSTEDEKILLELVKRLLEAGKR